MVLQESGEMYLETILVLSREKPLVRSIDVVERMSFSKPSVSRAMHLLQENGYLTMDESGFIRLTESGRQVAERIYERHNLLSRALELLGVDRETAVNDACRIEHYISDESVAAIKKHLDAYADR